MEKKKLEMDELESVSGGSEREVQELVNLYNQYNPDDPSRKLTPKVQRWIWGVMGYDLDKKYQWGEKFPHIYLGNYKNFYDVPDTGVIDHKQFMKLLNQRLAER